MTGCTHVPTDMLCTAAPGGRCLATGCQYPACNTATCVAGPCETAVCSADGTTCMRSSTCTAAQMCCGTTCVALGCNDGNPCTTDSCGGTACSNVPNTLACDDGNACTVTDRCAGGSCSGTGSPDCDDLDPCTSDSCVPATGCTHPPAPVGTFCDDGFGCTENDQCTMSFGTLECRGLFCSGASMCCFDYCAPPGICGPIQ